MQRIALISRSQPWITIFFYLTVFALTVLAYTPIQLLPTPPQIKDLWSGTRHAYLTPGSHLEPLKKILPEEGRLTFLTDHPYGTDVKETEIYHDIQNFLAPLILNPLPEERVGILYTSSAEAAEKRLTKIPYHIVASFGEGKGMIVKDA